MFGLSLAAQLFQGPAERTWHCVTQFTNLLWDKFSHIRHPNMPRSRRRHHSRSRSRSRSHSHDRDRDVKRRKIDNLDSPTHKRSVSAEPEIVESDVREQMETEGTDLTEKVYSLEINSSENLIEPKEDELNKSVNKQLEEKLSITPKRAMSPKQIQKKIESEKKRQQKQQEKEERERRKQQEKLEKLKQKQEKDEQKQKEKQKLVEQKEKERQEKDEQKRKEREEKELRRKEKEKEKEQEKLKRLQELEEKNKEKLKQEEQKQKAAAAFVNFFKKQEASPINEEKKIDNSSIFMPFQVKSDMRLPPKRRCSLTNQDKENLMNVLKKQTEQPTYLNELQNGKIVGKCEKTWPFEDTTTDDDVIVVEDFGETICEDKSKRRLKAKFLKFHENRRPPYFGTYRKTSTIINGRRPLKEDGNLFEYEQDSDDDWEEEEQGESLKGSDDEEKETDNDDDYEVDNDLFVPHGHLSEDEIDQVEEKLSPETQKQKLKLLKDEFDEDMKHKTNKLKSRSIGCIWYKKDGGNVDEIIDNHLKPLAMLTNGQVIMVKRNESILMSSRKKVENKELSGDLIRIFLKVIHGNVNKKKVVVEEFLNFLVNNEMSCNLSKAQLLKNLKEIADWKKCQQEGQLFNKFCWMIKSDVQQKYNVDLCLI